jgi:hypothetical protein
VGWKKPAVDVKRARSPLEHHSAVGRKHLRSRLEIFPQSAGKVKNVNDLFAARCPNLKLLGCFTALSSYRKLTVISSILIFGA